MAWVIICTECDRVVVPRVEDDDLDERPTCSECGSYIWTIAIKAMEKPPQ